MRPILAALGMGLMTAGLAACETPKVTTISQTSRMVVVQYPPANSLAAARQAASLCAEYGLATQLRSLHDQWATMRQTAIYDCVGS